MDRSYIVAAVFGSVFYVSFLRKKEFQRVLLIGAICFGYLVSIAWPTWGTIGQVVL